MRKFWIAASIIWFTVWLLGALTSDFEAKIVGMVGFYGSTILANINERS